MGVDSRIYIENIKVKDICRVLSYFDENYNIKDSGIDNYGYFVGTFNCCGEGRMLHIHETNIDIEASVKKYNSRNVDAVYHVEDGLPDKSWGIMASLGTWGKYDLIMMAICETYGGWYDYNDCDDKSYIKVKKNKRVLGNIIKRIFE